MPRPKVVKVKPNPVPIKRKNKKAEANVDSEAVVTETQPPPTPITTTTTTTEPAPVIAPAPTPAAAPEPTKPPIAPKKKAAAPRQRRKPANSSTALQKVKRQVKSRNDSDDYELFKQKMDKYMEDYNKQSRAADNVKNLTSRSLEDILMHNKVNFKPVRKQAVGKYHRETPISMMNEYPVEDEEDDEDEDEILEEELQFVDFEEDENEGGVGSSSISGRPRKISKVGSLKSNPFGLDERAANLYSQIFQSY